MGAGSSQQLYCILFAALTGGQITQVPYRGGAPAILDISTGRVDVMFGNMPEFMGQIRDGGLRPVFGAVMVAGLVGLAGAVLIFLGGLPTRERPEVGRAVLLDGTQGERGQRDEEEGHAETL